MNLQNIETIILKNINHSLYSEISISQDTVMASDFAALHLAVYMARSEILRNCALPPQNKDTSAVSIVAGTSDYTLTETDIDLIVKGWHFDVNSYQHELVKLNEQTLLDKIGENTSGTRSPVYYQVSGVTAAGLTTITVYPVPDTSTGTLVFRYKPVLSLLSTSTDEDYIMKKYPETVINLATAYAFQMIKKDGVNYDKFFLLGRNDFKNINLRESSQDPDWRLDREALLAIRRTGRTTI